MWTDRSIKLKLPRSSARAWCAGLVLLLAAFTARSEQLPIKYYTTADGLAQNSINRIVRDSRGFLWFCTAEGLSRFDGYSFTNYGTDQGLPHRNVTDFLETRGGEFWVATNAGLARFNPKGMPSSRVVYAYEVPADALPMFTVVVPQDEDRYAKAITVLLEDHQSTLWCGTWKGLHRLERSGRRLELRPVDIVLPGKYLEQRFVTDLLEDRHNSLWIATGTGGLYRRWPDGSVAHYTKRDGLPGENINDLLEDHRGQLWVGAQDGGFFRLAADSTHAPPVVAQMPINTGWVSRLFETADHRFWVATNAEVAEFFPAGDGQGRQFHIYTKGNGLNYHEITALGEDTGGNLWLGSIAGAMKLARHGFVTYGERDGLHSVLAIFEDRAGGLCFRGNVIGDRRTSIFEGGKLDLRNLNQTVRYWHRLGRFDGQRFTWFRPSVVPTEHDFGWVPEGITLQARNGEWWVGTGIGLYRFPASDDFTRVKTARPLAVYTLKDGLAGLQIHRLFEDSRGDIWVSTTGYGLARWERTRETWHDLSHAPGLPSPKDDLARSFGEDSAGQVWVGFGSGLARYRQGHFTFFTTKDGLPPGGIQHIYSDRRGLLWLASTSGGLLRVDDPGPTFKSYGIAQGLSSNSTEVITEDLNGYIYVGTGRGLDRLDPVTGRVKHFTNADGLAPGVFRAAFRDSRGTLWFGTTGGLSRFTPEPDEPTSALPILITNLRVAGERRAVSALGETAIALPDLAAGENQLQIDFVGLSFAPGEVLRYQYRLEGADAEWSAPSEQRTVNYAKLSPGKYRFAVRVVNADGVASPAPAVVSFTILPPLWQRWWFIALVMVLSGLLAYWLYRYRVARLLEIERVRTRIAADLHDDIGSSLSQVAVLSEVLRRQLGTQEARVSKNLSLINRISQEALDSMSDIVWAINPRQDHLSDLVRRMRRVVSDILPARQIEFDFRAPVAGLDLKLGADLRREVFLIFKEAINNLVRHSQCERAKIELKLEGGWLVLIVADNGKGFDPAQISEGNGLVSLHRRTLSLGGELAVSSGTGEGTMVTVKIPHRPQLGLRRGGHQPPGNGAVLKQ